MSESLPSNSVDEQYEPYINVKNITVTFDGGTVVACDDVNITIGRDELVVLLGPSGCGKTTMLRSIAGLEQPDKGEINVNGENITRTPPKDRNLAFVFQSIALFPHKSVRENIRFGLDMKSDDSTTQKEQKVESAAEMLGLKELLDRQPNELSGGQQQRVSIGRAVVMEPTAFLLDEPFAALDANLKDQMETEVKELQQQLGTAMIFVTHDQKEAMTLGDKIAVMNGGKIQQIGTPYEIYNDPRSEFVARFIGSPSVNIFDCNLRKTGNTTVINNPLFSIEKSNDEFQEPIEDNQAVKLGIRPENLEIDSSTALFEGKITLIEPEGTNDAVHLESDDIDYMAYPSQNSITEQGKVVSVNIPDTKFWLFEESGQRIL